MRYIDTSNPRLKKNPHHLANYTLIPLRCPEIPACWHGNRLQRGYPTAAGTDSLPKHTSFAQSLQFFYFFIAICWWGVRKHGFAVDCWKCFRKEKSCLPKHGDIHE